MKMTRIEKCFVNRKKKSETNIKKLLLALEDIEIEKIKTVLEIGCGMGFVSSYLAGTYGFNVFGVDYDTEQIKLAKIIQSEIKNLNFQVEDATKLSFGDHHFDLVLSQDVFHHIPNWEDAIKEIARILCPGGYFIWLDFSFPKIIKKLFLPFVKNYGLYTTSDLTKAFETHGFKNLSHEQSTHGLLQQHRFVLQFN